MKVVIKGGNTKSVVETASINNENFMNTANGIVNTYKEMENRRKHLEAAAFNLGEEGAEGTAVGDISVIVTDYGMKAIMTCPEGCRFVQLNLTRARRVLEMPVSFRHTWAPWS